MVTWDSWRYGSTTGSTSVVALSASLSRETRVSLSLLDLVVFSTYHYVLRICGIHVRIHNVSPYSLTQQGDERFPEISSSETVLEISYDVAMWHFIEASYNVKIECVYKGLRVKELWRFEARGSQRYNCRRMYILPFDVLPNFRLSPSKVC